MRVTERNDSDRVGMYLNPHTRNRLNKLKADITLETGKRMSQDDVITLLLDHYRATAPQFSERAAEYA